MGGEPGGTPKQEFPGVPPRIEPLLSEIQACATKVCKGATIRNESREVGLFKCIWMYFQDKFNIKVTKKMNRGLFTYSAGWQYFRFI